MTIPDVERNGYCFTEGNGFISKGLAKIVAERLPSSTMISQVFPSAYLIRMAGCKGLLIIDPQSNLDQFYVKIRPSMDKFKCDYWTLDICAQSRPSKIETHSLSFNKYPFVLARAKLNNQIILLLSDLGVPDETFLRIQDRWFQQNPLRSSESE